MTRETYHHGELREALIAQGLQQLEAGGEDALSLRALAKTAGVSPNAPYRHFADKRALFAAMAAEGFRRFAEVIVAAGEQDDAVSALREQGRAYLAFAAGQPALYRLMFSPYGYSLNSDSCKTEAERAFGALVSAVVRAQQAGWKAAQPLMQVVLSYWALLHGWAGLSGDNLLPPGVVFPQGSELLEVYFT
jgi:AcrR family transcriptional regulator